jgi:protein regulator of cytokinesis 1
MKFDVKIEAQLDELWQKIGLGSAEVEENYQELNRRVQALVSAFVHEHVAEFDELTREAAAAESAVRLHIQRFHIADDEGLNESAPLRTRIETAKLRLAQFEEDTREQQEEFQSAFARLAECFDQLEIEDRGEFAEEGTDCSFERIDRMNELITTLEDDISKRQEAQKQLWTEISGLRQVLGSSENEPPSSLGDETFRQLEQERDELEKKFEENKRECGLLLKAIRWLEKVMGIRTVTSQNLKVFGDAQIQKLNQRVAQLEREKDDHIADFIEAMKSELRRLWDELHIPTPSAADFPFVYNNAPTKRTLVALESEVHRLQNLKEHIAPMLDMIAARDEILCQYERLNAASIDPNRLTSRRGKAASFLMEEGRIRKRYSAELPKIHARLIPMLEEYEETFGEPFLWDGKPLLDAVAEMHRREEASVIQARLKQQTKRASPGRSRPPRGANALSQRAPFQLQEFMF